MKYIVIPMVKFIGAILFTVMALILHLVFVPIVILWEWEWPGKDFFEWDYDPRSVAGSNAWTIYYKRNPNSFEKVYFKSVFHFIWNIR